MVPEIVSCREAFAETVPETPSSDTDSCKSWVPWDADSINVAGAPSATERELGEAATPLGSVGIVTDTDPAKPFCPATDTCTALPAPPGASVTLAGDNDNVKLGTGGGLVPPPPPFPPPLPFPPHPAIKTRKLAMVTGWKTFRVITSPT